MTLRSTDGTKATPDDGVLEGSWGSWAIEVKTGKISTGELKGLGEFVQRYLKFRPLVVCDDEARSVAERAGFAAIPWTEFVLQGPPRSSKDDA